MKILNKFPNLLATSFLALCFLFATGELLAQAAPKAAPSSQGEYGLHQGFADVLSKFVDDKGLVNYKGLKASPKELNAYLKQISQIDKAAFDKFSRDEKLSFWMNSYNANTLKLILNNYPIKSSFLKSALWPKNSIKQIDKAWEQEFIPSFGKKISLNHIEHEIIRKQFAYEPRIHMTLVCAAISCPKLRNEPFIASKLEAQFKDQSTSFANNPTKVKFDTSTKTAQVSSIFKWYGKDFTQTYANKSKLFSTQGFPNESKAVLNFIHENMTPANQKLLATATKYDYLDYDWSLNEQ